MSGFLLKNNFGQVAFDSSRGQMMQFIGKFGTTQSGPTVNSAVFTCSGLPLVFVRNLSILNGPIIIVGIENVSGDSWRVAVAGQGAAGDLLSAEVYVFGLKTVNKPADQYGFVIKNSVPGGLDFFDARDRVLRLECYARTAASSLSPAGGGPHPTVPAAVIGGTIPTNWAVCATFSHATYWAQVSGTASAQYYASVSRINGTSCDFTGPTFFGTGSVGVAQLRGTYRVDAGFSAYFINTDLYQ